MELNKQDERTRKWCFGCGSDNDAGLQLEPYATDEGVAARWTPPTRFRGYANLSHGGIVAAALDEMMGWTIIRDEAPPHATINMNVEYRRPVWLGTTYLLEAAITERRSRFLKAHATIRDADTGELAAQATGVFARLKQADYERFTEGDSA